MELKTFENLIYAPGHVDWGINLYNVSQCYFGITPNIEENFSYAILEGQSIGLPFIAFDTGGNAEIIINNETGYIVDFLDIESLIEKSKRLLQNPHVHQAFQQKSKVKYHARFNSEKLMVMYEEVFRSVHSM